MSNNPPINPSQQNANNPPQHLLPSFANTQGQEGQLTYPSPAPLSLLGGGNLQPVSSFGHGGAPAGVLPSPSSMNGTDQMYNGGMNQQFVPSFPQGATPMNAFDASPTPFSSFGAQPQPHALLPTMSSFPPMPVMPNADVVQRDTEKYFMRELELKV